MSPGFGEPITPGPSKPKAKSEPRSREEEVDGDEIRLRSREKVVKKGGWRRGRGVAPLLRRFRDQFSIRLPHEYNILADKCIDNTEFQISKGRKRSPLSM